MSYFVYTFFIWNTIVMMIYGFDKHQAKKRKHRISEKMLLFEAFLLGAFGAILGMVVFNHKTSKILFRFLVPLAVVENIIALGFIMVKFGG